MKKQLVEVGNLEAFICSSTNAVYADGTIILTSGAKDELSKRGVAVVYGPKPEQAAANAACLSGCTCTACMNQQTADDDLDLLIAVAATLKNEYGVTDHEQLKTASCEVVAALKNHM